MKATQTFNTLGKVVALVTASSSWMSLAVQGFEFKVADELKIGTETTIEWIGESSLGRVEQSVVLFKDNEPIVTLCQGLITGSGECSFTLSEKDVRTEDRGNYGYYLGFQGSDGLVLDISKDFTIKADKIESEHSHGNDDEDDEEEDEEEDDEEGDEDDEEEEKEVKKSSKYRKHLNEDENDEEAEEEEKEKEVKKSSKHRNHQDDHEDDEEAGEEEAEDKRREHEQEKEERQKKKEKQQKKEKDERKKQKQQKQQKQKQKEKQQQRKNRKALKDHSQDELNEVLGEDIDLDAILEEQIIFPNRNHHHHQSSAPPPQGTATPSGNTPFPGAAVVSVQQAAPSPLDRTIPVDSADAAAVAAMAPNVANTPPAINFVPTDPSAANSLGDAVDSIDKPILQKGPEPKKAAIDATKSEGDKEIIKNTKDEAKKEKKESKDIKNGKDNNEPKEMKGEGKDRKDSKSTKDEAGASEEAPKENGWSSIILGVKSFANSIGSAVSNGFSKMKAVVTGDPHANEQHDLTQEPRPLP